MTRAEHLKFCKRCKNRKFDPEQGLICQVTNQLADFEETCQNFDEDETVKIQETEVETPSTIEMIARLNTAQLDELRIHQELAYAMVGGLLLSIVSALIWAVITVSTEFQIGYMAIGVGLIVGFGVQFFGAGVDEIYGLLGGFLAILGCALGNLFSQVGFIAQVESLGYIQVLMLLDVDTIVMIYQETFSFIDFIFYGIAAYEGYRFAFRPIPTDIDIRTDFRPTYSNLRLPLVIAAFLLISLALYTLSSAS